MVGGKLRRIWKTYWRRTKLRRLVKTLVVVILITGALSTEVFLPIFPVEQAILALLILTLSSLELLQSNIYDIEERILETHSQEYERGNDAFTAFHQEIIASDYPGNVYIVAYTGRSSSTEATLRAAEQTRRTVFLLLQHPEQMVSDSQRSDLKGMLDHWYREDDLDIKIRFYKLWATVRGVKAGKDYLGLGWYTYERPEKREPVAKGQSNPNIFLNNHHPEFSEFNDWYKEYFKFRWKNAETAECLMKKDVPLLNVWVGETKGDKKKKKEWIERISSDHPPANEIFPP